MTRPITSANRIYHEVLAALADSDGEGLTTRQISELLDVANRQKVSRAVRALFEDGLIIIESTVTTSGKDIATWRLSDDDEAAAALDQARLSVPPEDQHIRQHIATLPAGITFDIATVSEETGIHHNMTKLVLGRLVDEGAIERAGRSSFRTFDHEA